MPNPPLTNYKMISVGSLTVDIQFLSSLSLKNDFDFESFFFMQANINPIDPIVAVWNGGMLDLRMCLHDLTNRTMFFGSFTYSSESLASVLSVQNTGIHRWLHYVYFEVVPCISAIVHGPPIRLAIIRGFCIFIDELVLM